MKLRKISKMVFSKEELDQLNLLEQRSLLGGAYGEDNINTTPLCRCYYDNRNNLLNSNEADACQCSCWPY